MPIGVRGGLLGCSIRRDGAINLTVDRSCAVGTVMKTAALTADSIVGR